MDNMEDRNRKFQKSDFYSENCKREQFKVQLRKEKRREKINQIRFKTEQNSVDMIDAPTDSADEDEEMTFSEESIIASIKSLHTLDPNELVKGLEYLKNILSGSGFSIDDILESGAIEDISAYTQTFYSKEIRTMSLWVLSNMSITANITNIDKFIIYGMDSFFLQFLDENFEYVVEHALIAFNNFISVSENTSRKILDLGYISKLQNIIQKFDSKEIYKYVVWGTSNISHFDQILTEEESKSLLKICEKTLDFQDKEVKEKTLETIATLIRSDNNKIDLLLNSNLFSMCFALMQEPEYCTKIFNVASNICSGNNTQTQRALETGILDLMFSHLYDDDSITLYYIYFALSNIAAGAPEQLEFLQSHKIFLHSFNGLLCKYNNIKLEASYIVRNFLKTSSEDMKKKLITDSFLNGILDSLQYQEPMFVFNLLTVFEEFLQIHGKQVFLEKELDRVLEDLEKSVNSEVYTKCNEILEKINCF